MANQRKYTEVEVGGEIIKLEKVGESIEGVLESRRSVKRPKDGSIAIIYDLRSETVKDDKGGFKLWSIWGSPYMNSRLEKVIDGSAVRITLTGTQPATVKGQDPMKIYKVEVAQ